MSRNRKHRDRVPTPAESVTDAPAAPASDWTPVVERRWTPRCLDHWETLAQEMAAQGYHLIAVVGEENNHSPGYASFWERA